MSTTRTAATLRSISPEIVALLERADRATAAGSYDRAIELLTDANHIARNADTERELLRLRHQAAKRRPAEPVQGVWPPTVPDPFVAVAGLPEIDVAELDSHALGGGIRHHGAIIVRGFATPTRAEVLRDAVDRSIDAQREHDGGPDPEGWHAAFAEEAAAGSEPTDLEVGRAITVALGGLLAADSPRGFFHFADVLREVGFVEVVADYLGERPVLSADKTTFRRIREAPRPAWHQDGSFLGAVRAVNLWIALSHCGGDTDNIGLDVVPHRVEDLLATGTDDAEADEVAIGQALIDRVTTTAVITPEFRPGDAICFDERFLHRTSAAAVTGERHAIESWFFAPSHFPEQYAALAV